MTEGASDRAMVVEVVATTLAFPELCTCCGTTTQTTRMIGHTRHSGRVRHHTRWTVPSCERCIAHVNESIWGGGVAFLLFLLALCSFGLLSPLLWLWVRHKRARAQAMCSPECLGYAGPKYEPFAVPGGHGHRFIVHRTFARELAITQRAVLHAPSPALLAAMNEPR